MIRTHKSHSGRADDRCEICGHCQAVHVVVFSGTPPFRVCSACRQESLAFDSVSMSPAPVHVLPSHGRAPS